MRHKIKIIFVLIILSLQYACLDHIVGKPTFTLKRVSLNLQSMKSLQALLTVEVSNPNRFRLHFKSLEYRFAFENRETSRGVYTESFEVPASSVREITVPLTMEFRDLGIPLKSLIREKDIPYRIEGILHLKVLWGTIAIPFAKDGAFNIRS